MKKLTVFLCVILLPFAVTAAQNNSLPNGKPFQNLQLQIDDLKAQVDALLSQYTTIEARLSAAEAAIADLQAQNAELQSQIDANKGDISALQDQQATNTGKITLLQNQVTQLQDEIAMKQNIIHGVCPTGQAVVSVQSNGSLVCAPTGSNLYFATASHYVAIPGRSGNILSGYTYHSGSATAICPTGMTATGGGFGKPSDDSLKLFYVGSYYYNYSSTGPIYGWRASARNTDTATHYLYAYAICVRL